MIPPGETRPPVSLEVPVARVGDPIPDRRRRRAIVAGVVVFGLTVALGALPRSTERLPTAHDAPASAPTPAPRYAISELAASAPRSRRLSSPAPASPILPGRFLPGAPEVRLYARAGEALDVHAWDPAGGGLVREASLPGALAGLRPSQPAFVVPSPDGRAVLVQAFGRNDGKAHPLRLVDGRGVAWETAIASFSRGIWSPDGRWVVAADGKGSWLVADVAADPVVVVSRPAGGQDALELALPTSFSGDGRWIYGEVRSLGEPMRRAAVRMRLDGGGLEAVGAIPWGAPDGPLADGRAPLRDPGTGRTFDEVRRSVIEPDGSVAFEVAVPGELVDGTWASDGRLLLSARGPGFRVVGVTPDGRVEPLFELGDGSGALIDARDGFVLLAVRPADETRAARIVVVRERDGAAAAVEVPADLIRDVLSLAWVDADRAP